MGRQTAIFITVLAMLLVSAKDQQKWRMATVVNANQQFSNSENVAGEGSGMVQSVRERFDLLCGDVTYTVEQWVVPNQMLRLRPGIPIQFAIDGRKVTIRTPDGKTRKLKVVDPFPKPHRTLP